MSEEELELTEKMHAAISEALKDTDGGAIVTRWVLSVERYTADGKSVAFIAAPDMQQWEVIGMSEMASEFARIQASAGFLDDIYADLDDEDED